MRQIWVVDDDRSIRWVLEKALTRAQMPFRLFESAADVVKAFEHDTPSVLLSDIRMHDMSGLDLLAFVKNKYPGLPVIIMTAFSDLDSAVSAFQGGAYEYLAKPFDINSAIDLLRRAREESTVAESTDASGLDDKGTERRTEIIGQSRAMQDQPLAPVQVVLGKEFCLFATSEEEIIFRVCIPILPFNLYQGRLFVASDEIRVIVRYVLSGNQHLPSYKKVGVMEIVLVQHSVPA